MSGRRIKQFNFAVLKILPYLALVLTFLRKIRRSLIESGSIQKYLLYAIGEIALVVIGILIALQINNWNDYEKDRKDEQKALLNLKEEFKVNQEQFHFVQDLHQKFFDGQRFIIDVIDDSRIFTVAEDSLYTNLMICGFDTPTFDPSLGIVSSLINSGDFANIENDSLKTLLVHWPDLVKDYQEEEHSAQSHKINFLYPIINRIIKLPSRLEDNNWDFDVFMNGEMDKDLLESREFYNALIRIEDFSEFILIDTTIYYN